MLFSGWVFFYANGFFLMLIAGLVCFWGMGFFFYAYSAFFLC